MCSETFINLLIRGFFLATFVLTKIIKKTNAHQKCNNRVWRPHIVHGDFWHEWGGEIFEDEDKDHYKNE